MTQWHKYLRHDFCDETTNTTTMNTLKITLNGDQAARFLKIKKRLNYDSNAKILKTLIIQYVRHVRKTKSEKPDDEHISKYGDGYNPIEEGHEIRPSGYARNKRTIKPVKVKLDGDPLQIKIRLTDREAKTMDEIIKNSSGVVRSRYQIAKQLIKEFIKYHDGGVIPADKEHIYKVRKKRQKSEKSEK